MESRKSVIPLPSNNYSVTLVRSENFVPKQVIKQSFVTREVKQTNSRSPERVYHLLPELQNKIAEHQIDLLEIIDFDNLLKLFKSNKQLYRPLIYRALPKIIENHEETVSKYKIRRFDDLAYFTADLFYIKEYGLVKEISRISYKINPEENVYNFLSDYLIKIV